jgi:hypothetical protein
VTVEDDLRVRFAHSVESVVPDPDPYQRLLRRRRGSQLRRAGVGAAGLVAVLIAGVLAVPAVMPGTDHTAGPSPRASATGAQQSNDGEPIDSTWTAQLLDSPTRGGLSAGYLHELVETAQRGRVGMGIAPDLTDVAVLFVGDIGSARIGLVAFSSAERETMTWYVAPRGASAADLLARPMSGQFGGRGLAAFDYQGTLTWSGQPGSVAVDALIGLVPDGCRIATAKDAAHQQWLPEPTGSYLLSTTARSTEWWKVTCGNTVHYQGPARAAAPFASDRSMSKAALDSALSGARGTVDRQAAQLALFGLTGVTATTTGPVRVLWGGKLAGPGGSESPAVVAAAPASGGGWLVSTWWQPGGTSDGVTDDAPPPADVTGTDADLTSPNAVFAARIGGASGGVVVIAPRRATAVTASVNGRQVADAPLRDGVGLLSLGAGEPVTVRATDTHGQVVGEYVLGHHPDDPDPDPRPVINNW